MDGLTIALVIIVLVAIILVNSDRISRYVGRPIGSVIMLGIPLFTLGSIGASFLMSGAQEALVARASAGWPGVPGMVTRSRYDAGDSVRPRGLLLEYDFTVNGQSYQGTRVHFGHSGAFVVLNEAYAVQDKYPEGKTVTVYYDSRNPYNSVLEPGFRQDQWITMILGGAVLTVGLAITAAAVWAARHGKI